MNRDVHREKITDNIEELSSFFSFFKKNELKQEVFSDLELMKNNLKTIPILKEDLKKCNGIYSRLTEECSLYKKESKKTFDVAKKSLQEYKEKSAILLDLKDQKIESIREKVDKLYKKSLLVSALLSANSTNTGLKKYKEILYNEFLIFANKEKSLANEAEALLKLQGIEKELEIIAAYPNLHKKNTVAIGGSFSAGKSEFISSFFQNNIKLPISIEPTTAIPTYVISDTENKIIGCSSKGGIVNLRTIDDDFYSKISHDFIKSFNFNLKDIMPFMIVDTKFEYKHICFIDTPGYNPAHTDESYTKDDIVTAKEFLENASSLIWLIGLDANGTISLDDLEFLSDLELDDKKIYIVVNKADLRCENDYMDIMEEVADGLDDYDIEYIGISAFSSLENKEYSYKKSSIFDFIYGCNHESEAHSNIINKLVNVYIMYKRAILTTIKEKSSIKSHLQSILLDMLEEGFDNHSPTFQKLENLKTVFIEKEQEENLKILDNVIVELQNAIDSVFNKSSSIDFKNITLDDIVIDFNLNSKIENCFNPSTLGENS